LLLILVVALIFFGPRKLPQLSRQLGKSLAEFRKASDDFKSTWAREVSLETESEPDRSTWSHTATTSPGTTVERSEPVHSVAIETETASSLEMMPESATAESMILSEAREPAPSEPTRKADWL